MENRCENLAAISGGFRHDERQGEEDDASLVDEEADVYGHG